MKKRIYILTIIIVFTSGISFAQKGKVSSAVKKYEKLSYIASRNDLLELANKEDASPEVIEKLANTFYYNSEMDDAAKWYEKLVSLNPQTNPENYFKYAQALKATNNYKESDEHLELLQL